MIEKGREFINFSPGKKTMLSFAPTFPKHAGGLTLSTDCIRFFCIILA